MIPIILVIIIFLYDLYHKKPTDEGFPIRVFLYFIWFIMAILVATESI